MLGSIQHSYFGSTGEIQFESQSGLGDAVLESFGVSGIAQTGLRSGIIIIVLRARISRNIDLEMAVSDLQQLDLGDDLEVAGQGLGSRIITRFFASTVQQSGFSDAAPRLQVAARHTGRTVRVGAAGQHAGTCNGNSGKSGIFHKVTAGECIGHVRSSFKKQISTALRHYL